MHSRDDPAWLAGTLRKLAAQAARTGAPRHRREQLASAGTHDADGHLLVIHRRAHKPGPGGND